MDPTKNFDHLDPKLKETYARVMGTTAGDAASPQPAAAAPAQPPAPGNDFNQQPAVPAYPNQNMGPNPGTGPTISSIPQATSTVVAAPQQAQPAADPNGQTGSFFSNPSPATADPTQAAVGTAPANTPLPPLPDATQAPVTPYSPDQAMAASNDQPLQSPATAAQKGPHEASALLRVLYIIGGVIFFAIYTVFWIKIFNLPFLF